MKRVPMKKCGRCGCMTSRWDIHHKDENRENNEPSNLIVLCVDCHRSNYGVHSTRYGRSARNYKRTWKTTDEVSNAVIGRRLAQGYRYLKDDEDLRD